jgi:hypothetical protein
MLASCCGDCGQCQVTSGKMYGGKSGSGAHFSLNYLVSMLIIIYSYYCLTRCAIALTKQHIIIPLVLRQGPISNTGCGWSWRECSLVLFYTLLKRLSVFHSFTEQCASLYPVCHCITKLQLLCVSGKKFSKGGKDLLKSGVETEDLNESAHFSCGFIVIFQTLYEVHHYDISSCCLVEALCSCSCSLILFYVTCFIICEILLVQDSDKVQVQTRMGPPNFHPSSNFNMD